MEVILSSCYDFVERCCDVVLKHLSVMQKQRYALIDSELLTCSPLENVCCH